jgi:hypothetical protein
VSLLWRRALAVTTFIAACSTSLAAIAASGRVVLFRPSAADPTIAEALHRIGGELVADGFEVEMVDLPPSPAGAAPLLVPDSTEPGVIATIDLTVDEGAHVAELRVVDRLTNKVVTRRAPIDEVAPSREAEVLAVRAVELLRASLMELLIEARPAPMTPTPAPVVDKLHATTWAARGLPPGEEPAWGIEIGMAVLANVGGPSAEREIPASLLAIARLRRTLLGPLAIRVTVAGLGTEPEVNQQRVGSASMSSDLALFEAVLTIWKKSPVHPMASLGIGAMYFSVNGSPGDPAYAPNSSHQLSVAADGGAGVEVRLVRQLGISFEGHAFLASPYPVVEFLGTPQAHSGIPSLVGSASLVGWL